VESKLSKGGFVEERREVVRVKEGLVVEVSWSRVLVYREDRSEE
jgi:hypothetical protein